MARPKKEQGKLENITIRLPDDLRRQLDTSARKKGQRRSDEVRDRLIDSLKRETYSTPDLVGIMRLIGRVMDATAIRFSATRELPSASDWLEDQWTFDQVSASVRAVLEKLRPAGHVGRPMVRFRGQGTSAERHEKMTGILGEVTAQFILQELLKADDPELAALRTKLSDRLIDQIARTTPPDRVKIVQAKD